MKRLNYCIDISLMFVLDVRIVKTVKTTVWQASVPDFLIVSKSNLLIAVVDIQKVID